LVYLCSTKLPKLTLILWELDLILMARHRTLEAVDRFLLTNFLHVLSKDTRREAEFPKINSFNTSIVPTPKGCELCSEKNHLVRICPRFLQMTVDDRLVYILRKQLCSNCFASSHHFRDCTSAHNCLTCQDRHRALLHRNSGPTTPPIPSDPLNLPHFHTQFHPIQRKFSYKKSLLRILHTNIWLHIPPWMADVLEVLSPTNAESAKTSIL